MKEVLKYNDAHEKCYGVAGMAISIVALDAEDMLESLSLDADADNTVRFTPEFYFSGNPRLSARIAWKQILDHYRLSSAMVIANMMCREYVLHRRQISQEIHDAMLSLISEEGHESCSLDDDEIGQIFNNSFNYLKRLFTHQGVQSVARDFAATLDARRRLSRSEVIDELRQLSFL